MQDQSLLAKLSELQIKLEVKDGKLHVHAPTGVLTKALQEAISKQKNALMEMLLSARVVTAEDNFPPIIADPKSRNEPFALRDVQHAYWIGRSAQIELGSVSTHIYFELECGPIDPTRLTESFRKVIDLHEMLRAVIDVDGRQRILATIPAYEIAVLNLRSADAVQKDSELLRIRGELSDQLFPCDQWPLFDIRLIQISDTHSRLCVSWDFLMVDGWSLMLIFRQWFHVYQDAAYPLSTAHISFRDYVVTEAELKKRPAYQLSKNYWWERLSQFPPAPQLPVTSKVEPARKYKFKRRRLHLSSAHWETIKVRARRSAMTPTGVLLAAFSEVLNLWSTLPHYCLTLTLFNRLPLHPDVPDLVGDFTNLMTVEIDAREACSFVELGSRIQARFLQDYEHRQVNALEVMRELAKRHGWQQASFPVVFTSTLMMDGKRGDDAGELERFGPMGYGISQTPQVWLDYQVFEVNGDLAINWDAVEELFPSGVLDDMFESHCQLLSLLASNPDAWAKQSLATLPETQQQRRRMIDETSAEIGDRRLHDLFVQKAMEDPGRMALAFDKGAMSYGEVLAHSDLIAKQLMQQGVRPLELVAVVMKKGWEQVVAVLGVLIAGAAYLPIEPSWPVLRRNHILKEADVRFVLTQPALNSELQWPGNVYRMDVKAESLTLLATAPLLRQSAEDLAYVIFTSGSTGVPKGVMISHNAAVNTIVHVNRMFSITAESKVLAVSDLTFDLSVFDIFGLLAVGGGIVIPDAALSRDSSHWEDLIEHHRVTVWNSAPSLMGMLVDESETGNARDLSSLRCILLSGDWIAVSLPDRIRRLSAQAKVISLGGATEGSIWSIYFPVDEVSSEWDSIPYGKALPNQHVYVLNKHLRPCPELVTGDIYLGGSGVALGYWKDPEKTARQFIVQPETGERLYSTGDLGRMRRDGNIEFLGRADSQVKLRGHRVELGEITACLQSHPEVSGAAVRVWKQDNRTLLTAYVVANRSADSLLFEDTKVSPQITRIASSKIEEAGKHYCDRADINALERFGRFWKAVERASICAMLETLHTLELVGGSYASTRLDELVGQGRVLSQYRRLILSWLATLADAGHLLGRNGCFTVADKIGLSAARLEPQLIALEAMSREDESLTGFVDHVTGSLRNHLSLLSGELNPLELLFPEGSPRVAESLYERNAVSRHHNGLLASIVRSLVENSDGDRPLRVLDIGAGMGGTSMAVLPLLPASRTEYVYTDVSSYFFSHAKEKFKAYPFIRFSLYDLNKDATEQGLQSHGYDLIIASNVLHNALDVSAALRHIRELLQPGGHLLVLEGTRETPWMWASVAFLEMAHGAADNRSESDTWALAADKWLLALGETGFEGLQVFPAADEGQLSTLLTVMPQHAIVARSPAVARFQPEPLAAFLRDRLPDYMIPQRFVLMDKLPLTANGKVDLAALPAESTLPSPAARQVVVPISSSEEQILKIWREVLHVEQLSVTDNFFEVGGDSLLITEVMRRLNKVQPSPLTIAELLTYPTIRSLAERLSTVPNMQQRRAAPASGEPQKRTDRSSDDIAIIGMSGRFPDAENIHQFWLNLAAGKCAVRNLSDDALMQAGVTAEELADPNYVKAAFVLKDIDLFDAEFFAFTPRDAKIMDPQQRFLLECAVSALESAGYASEKHAGKIGVFVGKGTSLYLLENVLPHTEIVQQVGMMPILNLNEKDHAATLVSYKLNLTGPSVNVSTTCSTSLVAVHTACGSLLNHECEIALAGGVSFVRLQDVGYLYTEGSIWSPDGLCRAFSDEAKGTAFGSGVGLVVLKLLASALRDRDTIHAVIKGSAINNDGGLKLNYNAPSLRGQAEVIAAAHARAGAAPDTIQMLEAHGTGTELGDPLEFGALRRVFGGPRVDGSQCSLGSVKTNIGHLDAAAGVAGLIKVVEALKHKKFPPTLHARVASHKIDFADSPFELTTKLKDWPASATPRRAGVSSFGVGGTNAHVVVEEAPAAASRTATRGPQILPVSAKTTESCKGMMLALAEEFSRTPELPLQDVAYTLQVGRIAHPYRSYLICDQLSEARDQLAKPEPLLIEGQKDGSTPAVIFLLPGQGSLQKNVTAQLYENEPGFRSALDECAEVMRECTGLDIREWLYGTQDNAEAAVGTAQMEETAITQPLLFSVEYALARFWESLGVRPVALLGHSLGEYVAACIAGVFSLPEALTLMVVRGRLLQSVQPGHMLAVSCAETQLRGFLEGSWCSLAAVNGPSQCVASGSVAAIAALQARLEASRISTSLLRTSRAFHSEMVEPILRTFEKCVNEIERKPPAIPFISNVSGTWITDEEATSPAYWTTHLRHTVRFSDGLRQAISIKNCVLLEVGPGRILSTLARQMDRSVPAVSSLSAGRDSHGEWRSFLEAVGKLWSCGVEIHWAPLHQGRQSRRVPLPSYRFVRKSYWMEPGARLFYPQPAALNNEKVVGIRASDVGAQASLIGVSNGHTPDTVGESDQGTIAEIEARLMRTWKTYLGIENIGVRDSFFELGGDSLLAARVHAQIRREFDVELPLVRMFELETIRRVSLYVAISRDPELIDTLSEQDVDEALEIMDSWTTEIGPGMSKTLTNPE